jgi:hypothetical protein
MMEQLFTAKARQKATEQERTEQLFTAKDRERSSKDTTAGKVRRWRLPDAYRCGSL